MKKIFSLLGLLMLFCSSTFAAGTPKVIYERGGSTAWSDADLESWTHSSWLTLTKTANGIQAQSKNGTEAAVYSLNLKEGSIVEIEAEFSLWSNTGRYLSANTGSFFRFGSIYIIENDQDKKSAYSLDGFKSNTEFTGISGYRPSSIDGAASYYLTMRVNTATNTLESLVVAPSKGGDAVLTLTDVLLLNPDYSNIAIGYQKNGSMSVNQIELLKSIKITETEQDVTKADYTISYKLGNVEVKSESSSATIGNKVVATSPFTVDNQKYFIVDGSQTEFEVASSGNNFVVPVRVANNYKYTVNAIVGSASEVIGSGSVVEGESASVLYSKFVNVNGTLYKSNAQTSGPWWGVTVAPTSDNFVKEINYTQAATNIAFYSEAEDIAGITAVTGGNANIRCSMGAGGYFAGENGGVITTLQPGVYKLYTSVWGNAGATLTFKAGEKTILEAETKGYIQDYNTDEFIISEPTDIIMVGGSSGNAPKIADFVYIQKTADFVATEELTINLNEITIGENTKMTATLLPANASNKTLTWTIKESNSINAGEAEIDAATGEITPLKAGLIAVEVTNGEKTDIKEFTIAAAQFDVTITGAPQEAQVFVGDDASVENKLYVSTKAGYDDMQNTSLLQPVGSVTATKIPTYIYSITVDKKNKTVDVVYEEDIEVTAMNFAQPTQRIANGNSRTMQVVYSPADASFKTAKFTSSNPEVATVDENTGLVTAISEGETTITAEWSENESHGTNISTQMTLTVDKGLVLDRIVYDEMEDATAEVMGYYHPMDGDTLFLPAYIESNGREIPVSFIKQEAFIGSNLKSIVIPGTVKTIDHRALMYSNTHNAYNEMPEEGLESAFLLEGVEVMRDRIFHGNKYMKKVFLPSTLTDIGYYSFFDTAIEDVYFGGTAEQWNALKNLENAKLPESIKIHFNSDFTTAFINSIEVEEDYAEIAVGEEYEIKVSIIPEEIAPVVALTYTSSNEEVATVDEEGVVTGIADGYVTITVSAGEGLEAKVRVKVGDAARDYTTPLLTTWSVQGGANPEGIFVDEEEHYYNNWGAGTSWFAQAYAQFDLSNLQPTDDFKATFTVWVNCARGTRNFDICGLSANATVADCQELTAKKGVELASYSDITTEYQAKEVDVTEYLKTILSEGATTAIFIMSNGAAGGKIYGKGSAEFAPTLNIYPANGSEGGNQATGISEAKAEKSVKNGKYVENGQIVIYIDGKKFNAAGQELK